MPPLYSPEENTLANVFPYREKNIVSYVLCTAMVLHTESVLEIGVMLTALRLVKTW